MRNDNENRGLSPNIGGLFPNIRDHWARYVWVAWALWGVVSLGLASTDLITWEGFSSFRFWVGRVVPTVTHPPSREIIDPTIASSFLAILWATSPILWLAFRRISPEQLASRVAWDAPFSKQMLLLLGVLVVCSLMTMGYDWDSRRTANILIAHPLGFGLVASLVAALPWYTLALVLAWIKKVNEILREKEGR